MKKLVLAVALASASLGAQALVIHTDVYQVGCTSDSSTCTSNGNAAFSTMPSWTMNYDGSLGLPALASLSLVVEGVDSNEADNVFMNGNFVGQLVRQAFSAADFFLALGPGAFPRVTELTVSTFDVSPFLVVGLNTITVNVDPSNWINEIETASLTISAVPEPATLALAGLGLLGIVSLRRTCC